MKIVVRCRDEVEEGFLIREPYMLISIRDPDKPKVRVKKSGLCKAVLSLAFHDAEPTESLRLPPDIRLMTAKDAADIWRFVREHQDAVRAIVVHCEQGMSRSPAVAAGVAAGLGLDDRKFFERYQPNEFVRSLVSEASSQP